MISEDLFTEGCTKCPEGLHVIAYMILCDNDFRVWEAPREGYDGPMKYDEMSGDMDCAGRLMPRIWPE